MFRSSRSPDFPLRNLPAVPSGPGLDRRRAFCVPYKALECKEYHKYRWRTLLTTGDNYGIMILPLLRGYFFVPFFGCDRKHEGGFINR